jgi:hydrogenase maturation protein HypF
VIVARAEPLAGAEGTRVVALPRPVPAVLAAGAFLKNTLCLAEGRAAVISRPCGNLDTAQAILEFSAAAAELLAGATAPPRSIAHDRHPDFPSSRWAEAAADRLQAIAVPVQHHHAHVAAVMAEHGLEEPVLGLALDGFGLGDDGGAWGGELLLVDRAGYRRLGHLQPLRQPGADAAARQPWRMGAAALHALGRGSEIASRFGQFRGAAVIARMLEQGVNSPVTTSCGRLFDAACGLLGVVPVAAFEGEAPMALERLATRPETDPDGWRLAAGVLDLGPLLARLVGRDAESGANLFHGTLVAALVAWAGWAAEATGIGKVALAGGCFFNKVLAAGVAAGLRQRRLEPLLAGALGPGDPAISLGQAWAVAMAKG